MQSKTRKTIDGLVLSTEENKIIEEIGEYESAKDALLLAMAMSQLRTMRMVYSMVGHSETFAHDQEVFTEAIKKFSESR